MASKIKLSKALRLMLEYQAASRLIDLAVTMKKRKLEKEMDYGRQEQTH